MNLAQPIEPDANFDSQRRLNAYAPILQWSSLDADDRHGSVLCNGPLEGGVGR